MYVLIVYWWKFIVPYGTHPTDRPTEGEADVEVKLPCIHLWGATITLVDPTTYIRLKWHIKYYPLSAHVGLSKSLPAIISSAFVVCLRTNTIISGTMKTANLNVLGMRQRRVAASIKPVFIATVCIQQVRPINTHFRARCTIFVLNFSPHGHVVVRWETLWYISQFDLTKNSPNSIN